jgi:hypothetical protein
MFIRQGGVHVIHLTQFHVIPVEKGHLKHQARSLPFRQDLPVRKLRQKVQICVFAVSLEQGIATFRRGLHILQLHIKHGAPKDINLRGDQAETTDPQHPQDTLNLSVNHFIKPVEKHHANLLDQGCHDQRKVVHL